MKASEDKKYTKESEMCADFLSALPDGWTAYPETADWDILLSRDSDGFQIGIEAKLRLNAPVLSQALEEPWPCRSGPDCRAVLVPKSSTFSKIAAYIGITVITINHRPGRWHGDVWFNPSLPQEKPFAHTSGWFELAPYQRVRLPEYIPDVEAGVPSPIKLTEWKIQALKIAVLLERRGYVNRSDFKALRIDHRRWLPNQTGWLQLDDQKRLVPGKHYPDFRSQHPRVYEEIAADFEKWAPKDAPTPYQMELEAKP